MVLSENRRSRGVPAHIETNLFHEKIEPIPTDDSIHIIQAPSPAREVEAVAREIRKLVAEKELKFSNIGVLLRTTEGYRLLIGRIFEKFRIPHWIDGRENLLGIPLIKAARHALTLAAGEFDPETFLALMKSASLDIDSITAARVQNYSMKYGLSREDDWRKEWQKDEDFSQEIVTEINRTKARLFDLLDRWRASLKKGTDAEEFERVVFDIVKELAFSRRRASKTADLDAEFYRREGHAITALVDILGSIKKNCATLGSVRQPATWFLEKIEDSLKQHTLSLGPVEEDFVHVCNVYESRLPEYEAVFVIGLQEKIFPRVIRNEPFFKDNERRRISDRQELHLPEVLGRVDEERYLFYIACTRSTGRLYLTCHTSDLEGNEAPLSHYLDDVKRLFTIDSLESATCTLPLGDVVPAAEDLINIADIENFAAQHLWQSSKDRADEKVACHLYNKFLSTDDRYRAALGEGLNRGREELSEETIRRLQKPRYWMSITEMDTYGECPFRYFIERILEIKPRAELRFRAIEEGKLYHEVLQQLMTKIYRQMHSAIENISLDELFTWVEELIDRHIAKHCAGMFDTPRTKVQRNSIAHTLKNFICMERENQQQNRTTPHHFELAFSRPRDDEEQDQESVRRMLEINCGKDLSLFLGGRIDRVDILEHNDEEYGVVIDYKRSDRGSIKFEEGQSLQCPLYMLALEKIFGIKAAGSFYYSIANGRKRGIYNEELADKIEGDKDIYKNSGFSADELKRLIDINVSIAIDRVKAIRDGHFQIQPLTENTCRICNYRLFCRR